MRRQGRLERVEERNARGRAIEVAEHCVVCNRVQKTLARSLGYLKVVESGCLWILGKLNKVT